MTAPLVTVRRPGTPEREPVERRAETLQSMRFWVDWAFTFSAVKMNHVMYMRFHPEYFPFFQLIYQS